MKVLANQKVRRLFYVLTLILVLFSLFCVVFIKLKPEAASFHVLILSLCMGLGILAAVFHYFSEQDKLIENAIAQIRNFLGKDQEARIECDQEGELYRLFHEINSLAAVLKAHAENEKTQKKFLKDTLSNISHQLKTPLAALNIYNGIMQEEAKALPAIQDFLSLSEQELDRIETLVQNLLKIAKLDSGTIVMDRHPENIAEMMDDIQRRFACRAEQEEKNFLFRGDDSITFSCDRNWFLEAVGNIVKNALDHTEKGDTVQVEWKQFASVVQILIKDSGNGIHPEDLPHIFKRFYRSRFSQDVQGVGLGLSLAKTIVEAHSGTIEADSTPEGGTIFTLSFLTQSSDSRLARES